MYLFICDECGNQIITSFRKMKLPQFAKLGKFFPTACVICAIILTRNNNYCEGTLSGNNKGC